MRSSTLDSSSWLRNINFSCFGKVCSWESFILRLSTFAAWNSKKLFIYKCLVPQRVRVWPNYLIDLSVNPLSGSADLSFWSCPRSHFLIRPTAGCRYGSSHDRPPDSYESLFIIIFLCVEVISGPHLGYVVVRVRNVFQTLTIVHSFVLPTVRLSSQ